MHVSYIFSLFDLVKFSLYMMPRSRATYKLYAVFFLIFFVVGLVSSSFSLFGLVVLAIIAAIASLIAILFFSFYSILVSVFIRWRTYQKGAIYSASLSEAGLTLDAHNSEGLICWSGIDEIKVLKPYILFRLGLLYHVIPRRSFATEEQCRQFIAFAQKHFAAAKKEEKQAEGQGCIIIQDAKDDPEAIFRFQTDLQRKDTFHYVMAYYHRTKMLYVIFILLFIATLLITGEQSNPWWSVAMAMVSSLALFAVIMGIIAVLLYMGSDQSSKIYNFGELHYRITQKGISYQSLTGEGEVNWNAISTVETYQTVIVLKVGLTAIIFPRRSFSGEQEFGDCAVFIKEHWQAAKKNRTV